MTLCLSTEDPKAGFFACAGHSCLFKTIILFLLPILQRNEQDHAFDGICLGEMASYPYGSVAYEVSWPDSRSSIEADRDRPPLASRSPASGM